jgi:hypothetical protein
MKRSGQAVVVVVAVLSVVFTVGIAFYILSQAEKNASIRHLDSLRARYIAEAGVVYAQKVLELDRRANLIDSLEDTTFTSFSGQDADLDADTTPESRYIEIPDSEGKPFGHFSILISDEAAKVHLNVCSRQVLEQLFTQKDIAFSKIDTIFSRRPFNAIEQIGAVLGRGDFKQVKDFVTVYSRDPEIDLSRKRRVYLNSLWPQKVLESFLNKGIRDTFQKAANLKDAADSDLSQTQLVKFSLSNLRPSGMLAAGGWVNAGGYYEASAGSAEGEFIWSNLPLADGEYFCYFNAPDEEDTIGEVLLDEAGAAGSLLHYGEGAGKKVTVSGGTLSLRIKPAEESSCRFSSIELVDMLPRSGLARKMVCGTEALVINELMVKLSSNLSSGGIQISPGQNYKHIFSRVRSGYSYLRIKAVSGGGLVGDVSINGQMGNNLRDGDYFPFPVHVECDDPRNKTGPLTIEIKNNSLTSTTFGGVTLLQQPDAEYAEILNLSSETIDLENFLLVVYNSSGELVPGWPASIPKGVQIGPYQHLVLAVDSNDGTPAPANLKDNGISFQAVWETAASGLVFSGAESIDKQFDAFPDIGGTVMLCNAQGQRIDAGEYSAPGAEFMSLERGDPSAYSDNDGDGLFDGWFISSDKDLHATPAETNENSGMYTQDKTTGDLIQHFPTEVKVFNRPLTNLSEALQLASGYKWKRFSILDLALMADHFAYQALDFNFVGNYEGGDFLEHNQAYQSRHEGDSGIWKFPQIPRGDYLLTIFGDEAIAFAGNEKVQVSLKTEESGEFSLPATIFFTSQGVLLYGKIEFPKDPALLSLQITNNSEKKIALKKIRLEPIYLSVGRININTAKREVLRSIFTSDTLVDLLLQNRPLGAKDNRKLGIGELFLLDENFLAFHDYLTVKSDAYEINSRGEYSPSGKTLALQNIRSVVERGE